MNDPRSRKLDRGSALTADQARRDAMAAGDLDGLAALLADECLYVHSTGAIDTKQSYLAKLAGGSIRYTHVAALDVQLIELGPAVIVSHRMHAQAIVDDLPRTLRGQAASIWVAAEDGPKLVYFQSTTLPAL
jgi:ketosteroid isomerase-like protein